MTEKFRKILTRNDFDVKKAVREIHRNLSDRDPFLFDGDYDTYEIAGYTVMSTDCRNELYARY